MFNVLIAEDEKPSSDNLVAMLNDIDRSFTVAAIVQSIPDTILWLLSHPKPSLIFMDIQLKDGLSFSIFQQVNISSPVIFTTGFDHYLIEAFEHNGIDYLLKPLNKMKLAKALDKFKNLQNHFVANYSFLAEQFNHSREPKRNRIAVKRGTELRSVKHEDVAYFFTENKIVFLVTKENEKYLVNKRLRDLDEELDNAVFFRVNRKFIINIDHVKKVKQLDRSQLQVELLLPLNEPIIISQENASEFKQWLDQL